MGMHRLQVSETFASITPIGTWGIRRALVGVGFPTLSGVLLWQSKAVVHDMDSGDVDGDSGIQGVVGS